MKRFLSAVAAAAVLTCTLPSALAVSDITGHWAEQYMTEMHELGVINPSSSTGNYTPETPIMRWEFMRYVNRAFGFTDKAQISYSDVSPSDIFYETIQTAVAYGYINGVADDKMDPEGTLTREQAATILGRLHKYTPDADLSELDAFSDREALNDYSRAYVAEAVAQGYIDGYSDGTFKPRGSIKRAEIAKILYFFLGSSLAPTGRATRRRIWKTTVRTSPSPPPARCPTRSWRATCTSPRAWAPARSRWRMSPLRARSSSAAATSPWTAFPRST